MFTRNRVTVVAVAVVAIVLLTAQFGIGAFKIDLGTILKAGGALLVVDKLGPQINSFINTLYGERNVKIKQATKVVPILSIGDGTYLGAVQIMGGKAYVKKCTAVVQLEGSGVFGSDVRIKAFVPVSQRGITKIKRIQNVGISAIVDIKLGH